MDVECCWQPRVAVKLEPVLCCCWPRGETGICLRHCFPSPALPVGTVESWVLGVDLFTLTRITPQHGTLQIIPQCSSAARAIASIIVVLELRKRCSDCMGCFLRVLSFEGYHTQAHKQTLTSTWRTRVVSHR